MQRKMVKNIQGGEPETETPEKFISVNGIPKENRVKNAKAKNILEVHVILEFGVPLT